jgi:hypothetical protein
MLMMVIGKALLGIGLLLALVGAFMVLASRLGLSWGRLPGDMVFRGRHVSIYLPLGTSIILSVVLSLILWVISRLHR